MTPFIRPDLLFLVPKVLQYETFCYMKPRIYVGPNAKMAS